jgi:hypothetical protein
LQRTVVEQRAWVVGAIALVVFAFTAGWASAQGTMPSMPMPSMPTEQQTEGAMTHEQMHQMMDAMHGEGASERMHEAMGEDAERMMDQCVAMMTMSTGGNESMPDMMRRMMGR